MQARRVRCANVPAREVATISPRKFSVVEALKAPRHLLALVRGQFERNEMLPRKLDRTGTNAHTSIGVHRIAPTNVLPTICRLWPRTSSPWMLLTRREERSIQLPLQLKHSRMFDNMRLGTAS